MSGRNVLALSFHKVQAFLDGSETSKFSYAQDICLSCFWVTVVLPCLSRTTDIPFVHTPCSSLKSIRMCRLKRTPGVEEIMLAVDRELAEHGLLDASACLFRGCHICILQLPGTCSDQEQV